MAETRDENDTCNWFRKTDLKVEMKTQFYAAQEQAVQTIDVKHKINKSA